MQSGPVFGLPCSTQNVSQLIKLDCERAELPEPDAYMPKLIRFTVSKTDRPNKIPVGATWGHRLHNFLAVGAIAPIAPMESAPMIVSQSSIPKRIPASMGTT